MSLRLWAVTGIGEIVPGDDLSAIIAEHADLADGDVVIVTSKVVAKAAGLATTRPKEEILADQTDRVVARRGGTAIVRTVHGLTLAAAGIDASNTEPGTVLPLPADPDAEARRIRRGLRALTGLQVAVIVSDTAGRAWRVGQTDIAIGCAGLLPYESFEGRTDSYGNPLAVTAPAIADQLAGAAELASGKLSGCPVVIARGTNPDWQLADDGPGAAALIRDADGDLFGLGSREAVLAAVTGPDDERSFPAPEDDLARALIEAVAGDPDLGQLDFTVTTSGVEIHHASTPTMSRRAAVAAERLRILSVAYRQAWTVTVRDGSSPH